MPDLCPRCAHPVSRHVYSGGEGTNSYEPCQLCGCQEYSKEDWTKWLVGLEVVYALRHEEGEYAACSYCGSSWPCDAYGFARTIADLRALVEEIRKRCDDVGKPIGYDPTYALAQEILALTEDDMRKRLE